MCLSTHINFSKLCHEPSFIYFNNENINMRNNFICHGEGVISNLKLLWILNFTLPVNSYNSAEFLNSCDS